MADRITGRFVADFTDFNRAVEEAEVELRGLETESSKVEKSLNRMVDQFSGRKLIQDAVLMAEAVERIGGASQLTERELEQLGGKAAEAVEKMRALGMDVPAGLNNLAAAGTKTNSVFTQMVTDVGKMATSFFTAQLAIDLVKKGFDLATDAGKAFLDMVMEGSDVADVADNFDRLAGSADNATAIMDALREGTHNTVTNFELMKTASGALTAGLNLTADEFQLLAQGAFAVAQSTGGSVTDGLKAMTEAMVTGKTKTIEARYNMIDLEKAEEDFAATLGTTAKNLSEEGKLQAARIAILDAVSSSVGRLGQQTDGLDEKVAQAQVQWQNFQHELGASIATSPVVMAAIDSIGKEIARAFGVDKKDLVKAVTRTIEDLAIQALGFGDTMADVGGYVAKAWVAIDTQMNIVKTGYYALAAAKAKAFGTDEEYAEAIRRMNEAFSQVDYDVVAGKHKAIDDAVSGAHGAFQRIRTSMEAARDASRSNTEATTAAEPPVRGLAAATNDQTGALIRNTTEQERNKAAKDKMKEADEAAKNYLERELDLYERQKQAAVEVADLKAELDTRVLASTGTRVDQEIAEVERWATDYERQLREAGTWSQEAQDLIVQITQSKINEIMGLENALTENTRTAVEQRAEIERNRLNDMIANWDKWGTDAILEQEQVALAAEDAAANFAQPWNSALETAQGRTDGALSAMSTSFTQFGVLVTGATEGAAAAMSTSFMENGVLVVGAANETANGIVAAHGRAAQQVVTSWSEAMEQVRQGKGTMEGAVPSGGPGTMTNYGPWGSPEHQAYIARMAAQGRYFGPVTHRGENPAYPGYESAGANIIGPDWEALGMTTPAGGFSWAMLGGKENAYEMFHRTWGGSMGRAAGGRVAAGEPYVVGESGPELFLPTEAGTILPNAGTGSAPTGVVMHNVFHVNGTGADVARIVSAELTRLMRVGRKWPAV